MTIATTEVRKSDSYPKMMTRKNKRSSSGLSQLNQQDSIKQILGSSRVQAKLTIGEPDDVYEKQADRVADQVMNMSSPGAVQTKCACGGTCEKCQQESIQAKSHSVSSTGGVTAPESIGAALASPGKPLDASTRDFFEPRLNKDLSAVRVHTDNQAKQSAKDISARAFTLGQDIVFAENQYRPHSYEGRHLLAHELTHVIQQSTDKVERKVQRAPFGIVLPTGLRFLDSSEEAILRGVYGSSLIYGKILLSNGLGGGGRPFTLFMTLPIIGDVTVIQIGASAYNNPGSNTGLLIHEAAHSWQSQHHPNPARYMTNSIESQAAAALVGASAYCYVTGKWFGLYAAEQIAEQAEDGIAAIRSHMRGVAPGSIDMANVASLAVPRWETRGDPGVSC